MVKDPSSSEAVPKKKLESSFKHTNKSSLNEDPRKIDSKTSRSVQSSNSKSRSKLKPNPESSLKSRARIKSVDVRLNPLKPIETHKVDAGKENHTNSLPEVELKSAGVGELGNRFDS